MRPGDRLQRGRALAWPRERMAHKYAASVVEQSTLPRLVLAQHYRRAIAVAVEQRQYRNAGFVRRVAEFLEGGLWEIDYDELEMLALYRQLSPELRAEARARMRRLIAGEQPWPALRRKSRRKPGAV